MRGRDIFNKYKKIISILVWIYSLIPFKYRLKKFNRLRYKKGIVGIGLRYILFKTIAKKCGDNVLIGEGCFILHPEKMEVGSNVSIQPICYIDSIGGLSIGNDVSIAHGVTIMTSNHNYLNLSVPIREQGVVMRKVTICENVWIGAKATILYGNTVNSGVIVGAGAVVTKDIDNNVIAVGIPAKKIGVRGE